MVDFRVRGKRYRKSTGTSDRKQAELILKKIEVDIASGKFGIDDFNQREVLFGEFIDKYLVFSKATKARNTFLLDERALKLFRSFWGEGQLGSILPRDIEAYKIARLDSVKPSSVNVELKHLKSAFETAVRWEMLESNPFRKVKLLKVKGNNFPKFFTKEEVAVMLSCIPEGAFKALILFYLYTGCRRNEALDLKWGDVDLEEKTVTFLMTKSGLSRVVPFNGELYPVLQGLPRDGERVFPFKPDYVTHQFKKIVLASGIENATNLHVHSLRHTYASHLVMAGVDIKTVSELLGHSSVKVTEMYAHLMPNHLKASVERLRF